MKGTQQLESVVTINYTKT